ncbi:MAG: uracil-DNA glycosylase [Candidatus Kariarchaeaceae archaeon]
MDIPNFIKEIQNVDSRDLFNPYRQTCPHHDIPDAQYYRSLNLQHYLNRMQELKPVTLWLGEALGYRGGRRTGLPFTDESNLLELGRLYQLKTVQKTTMGVPVAERTATSIWNTLNKLPSLPFLWNIVPFHPHKPSRELSNRSPTRVEITLSQEFLQTIVDSFEFSKIITVGRKAAQVLEKQDISHTYVRHPSYGGAKIFQYQIKNLFS